jgi:hypothetical protein
MRQIDLQPAHLIWRTTFDRDPVQHSAEFPRNFELAVDPQHDVGTALISAYFCVKNCSNPFK